MPPESTSQTSGVYSRMDLPDSRERSQEIYPRISQAGFDGIEIALNQTDPQKSLQRIEHLMKCFPEDKRRFLLAYQFSTWDIDQARLQLAQLMQSTSQLGCEAINLTLPARTPSSHSQEPIAYSDAIHFLHRILVDLRFTAESTGVVLAIEAGAGGLLISPEETRELLDDVNSWVVGVCLDVARLASFSSVGDWIAMLTHRIHAVRIAGSISQVHEEPNINPVNHSPEIAQALEQILYQRSVIVDEPGYGQV